MKSFNRLFVVPLAIVLSVALPALGATQKYALDPAHTQVHITWNHAGFSNPGASFDISEGMLVWDAASPGQSSVTVSMPVNSVNTQVPALDETFRTQYFDAAKHPAITFASTRVERVGTSDRYRVEGNLTIRGITKPVTLDATLNKVGEHPMFHAPAIGFDATATVKRSEFGLDAYIPMVSDLVRIHITAEGVDPAALKKATQEEAK